MEQVIINPKCTACHCYFTQTYRRNGVPHKTCERCRLYRINYMNNYKCSHGHRHNDCVNCGGVSICEHNKRKSECVDCHGSQICIHNKIKKMCIECDGISICVHLKQKSSCKKCGNEVHKTIIQLLCHSKTSDKKKNRFDETNFITYDFVSRLITQSNNKCYYCMCDLQFIKYNNSLATIERLDNKIGHIIDNCVIACKGCNSKGTRR